MKKPIIAIAVVVIAIVLFSVADFETSVDIPKTSDTAEAGDNVISDGTLVTVVEVTDDSGEIVATEQVTFSQDDVKFGQEFFAPPVEETTLSSGISADRLQAINKLPESNNVQVSESETVKNTEATIENSKPLNQSTTIASSNKPGSNTTTTKPVSHSSTKPSTQNTTVSENQTVTNSNTQTTQEVVDNVTEPEITELDIVMSTKYYFEGRIVDADGNVSVYKIARDGRKYSAVAMAEGQEMGIISNDTEILIVSVTEKTYMSIPLSFVQENSSDDEILQSFLSGDGLNSQRNEVSRYTANEDGLTYDVIEYENGSKDYMYGTLLIKTTSADGSVFYYDVITTDFPSSVFMAPVGYEKKELSEVGASEFAEDLGVEIPTTQAHSHEDE